MTSARKAGQHARSVANRIFVRMLAFLVASLLVIFVAYLAFDGRGLTLVLIELVVLGLMVAADRLYTPKHDRWLRGARGEEHVGEILDRLAGDGWYALHDVSLGRGNIDHLLVGPGGIFTVETKSQKRPVRIDRIPEAWLNQAYAQKKLIERITGYKVQPLLVFSDAWLLGRGMARRKGVVILTARMLESFIDRQSAVVTADRARQFHSHLASALATS